MDNEDEAAREGLEANLENGCVEMVGPGMMRLRPKGIIAAFLMVARSAPEEEFDPAQAAESLMDDLAKQGVLIEPVQLAGTDLTKGDEAVLLLLHKQHTSGGDPLTTAEIARETNMPTWRAAEHLRRLTVAKMVSR